MGQFSWDDVEDEVEVAKRRKTGDEGEGTSKPPSQTKIGGKKTVTMDTDLLDCSICENHLSPPINQCKNGHWACTSCWDKLHYKCHICGFRVQYRNIALEKVLEAVYASCTYFNLGCRKIVSYSQRQVHTDTCEFGPSLCPIPGCARKVFSGAWQDHFVTDSRWGVSGHCISSHHYRYDRTCIVSLENDLYHALLGPGKDLFLLVKEPILNVGNFLSLYYIDLLHQDQHVFSYELMVSGCNDTCSVQLNSKVISIKEWKRGEVRGRSLLVPLGFTESRIKVHVLIKKELEEELDGTSSD